MSDGETRIEGEEMATDISVLEARVVNVERDVSEVRRTIEILDGKILAKMAAVEITLQRLVERMHSDEIAAVERRCPAPGLCNLLEPRIVSVESRLATAEKRLDEVRLWNRGLVAVLAFMVAVWPILKEYLK